MNKNEENKKTVKKKILLIIILLISFLLTISFVGVLLAPTPKALLTRLEKSYLKTRKRVKDTNVDFSSKNKNAKKVTNLKINQKNIESLGYIIEFFSNDILKKEDENICNFLSDVQGTQLVRLNTKSLPTFEEQLVDAMIIGRENIRDPAILLVFQSFSYFSQNEHFQNIIKTVDEEYSTSEEISLTEKLSVKTNFLFSALQFSKDVQSEEYLAFVERYIKPTSKMLSFLYDYPEFSNDKDVLEFCNLIQHNKLKSSTPDKINLKFKGLLIQKGLEGWK